MEHVGCGVNNRRSTDFNVEIMSTLMNICGHTDKWWSDEVYDYTPSALVEEIIEMKQSRADAKMLDLKHDCELIYNQYTEQRE